MADLNIKISDLRTQITFQSETISKDAGGAQKPAYTNVETAPTVWALWVNDHGQESVQADAKVSEQRATVTIRYRSDVLEAWQILKDGSAWKILSIDQVRDRNRWTELRVERVKGSV